MTGRDALDDRTVEQLLSGRGTTTEPGIERLLATMHALGEGPAPRPSGALAELLDQGFDPPVVPLRAATGARRRWATRAGAAVAAAMASILLAGTAQALPPAVQNTMADLVAALTPYELPRPPVTGRPAPVVPPPAGDVPPAREPGRTAGAVPSAPTASQIPTPTSPPPAVRTGEKTGERSRTTAEKAAERSREAAERSREAAREAAEDAAEDAADEAEEAETDEGDVSDGSGTDEAD